jgi:hypothetical protein
MTDAEKQTTAQIAAKHGLSRSADGNLKVLVSFSERNDGANDVVAMSKIRATAEEMRKLGIAEDEIHQLTALHIAPAP